MCALAVSGAKVRQRFFWGDNLTFNKGSYGFSVASIIFPLAVTAIALLLYIILWLYHVITTICAWLGGRKKERLPNSNVAVTD
jgi:hypothetical protein